MPKLKSGRHVGVGAEDLVRQLSGTSEQVYAFVLAYRLSVRKPEDLLGIMPVVYYRGEGGPPDAEPYRSGFLVQDVLSGKAGWTPDEISEFRQWLETNEQLVATLTADFRAVEEAIRKSPLWDSELITDKPETTTPN
jgi:hypothetical protein